MYVGYCPKCNILLQLCYSETVKRLKDYFLGVVNASVSIDTAIQEAERLLNEIRLKDFSAVRIDADSESR